MKKFFYISALALSAGLFSSCAKENSVTPKINKVAVEAESADAFVGNVPPTPADGGVDRPKRP